MKRFGLALLILLSCVSAHAQLLNRALQGERRLPTTFYADIADPTVTTINLPPGTYNFDNGQIVIARSNLTIDFNGSTLIFQPQIAAGSTISGFSVSSTPIDAGYSDPPSPLSRVLARVQGVVTPSTDRLTLAAGERGSPPSAGEKVMLHLGINTNDLAESEWIISATVLSYNAGTGEIIFTQPLGVTVTQWADVAAIKAVVDSGQWYKLQDNGTNNRWGQWYVNDGSLWDGMGGPANFTKGLGNEGGIERFTDFLSNITIKNARIKTIMPSGGGSAYPTQSRTFDLRNCDNITLNNIVSENLVESCVFTQHVNNSAFSNFTFTGEGKARQSSEPSAPLQNAYAFKSYGGDHQTFSHFRLENTTNILPVHIEVQYSNLLLDDWHVATKINNTGLENSNQFVLGGFGSVSGTAEARDFYFQTLAGSDNSNLLWANGQWQLTNTLEIGNAYYPFDVEWGSASQDYSGVTTNKINSTSYTPYTHVDKTGVHAITIPANGGSTTRHLILPAYLWKHVRFRLTTVGGADDVYDSMDNSYSGVVLTPNTWVTPGTTAGNGHSWTTVVRGTNSGNNRDYPGIVTTGTHQLHIHFGANVDAVLEFEGDGWPGATNVNDWTVQ